MLATFLIGWILVQAESSDDAGIEPVHVHPGSEIRRRLSEGETLRAELDADTDGPLTIVAESEDFDATLSIARSGRQVDLQPDAGIDGDEWVVLDLRRGERASLALSAADAREGEIVLRVCDGAQAPPVGGDRWRASIARLDRRAIRAAERGDRIEAALALERRFHLHVQGDDLPDAREDARRFLEAARDGPPRLEARALTALGTIESLLYEPRRAAPLLERALSLEERDAPADGLVELRERLGLAWCRSGRFEDGYRELDRAVEEARARGSADVLAPLLARYGSALVLHGDLDAARGKLDEAGRMLPEVRRAEGRAFVLGNQALLLQVTGRFREALATYEQAIGQGPPPILRMEQLGSLALVHCQLDMLDQAGVDLEEARRLAASLGVDGLRAKHLHLQGSVQWRQGHAEDGRRSLEEALSIAGARGDMDDVVEILVTLGAVHGTRGDLPRQRECFEKLRAIAQEKGDDRLMGRALRGLGSNLLAATDFEGAATVLRSSGEIAHRFADAELEADAVGTLAWAQYQLGIRPGSENRRFLDEAIDSARRAVAAYDDGGKRLQALEVLETIACAGIAGGRVSEARAAVASAFRRLEEAAVEEEEGAQSPLESILTTFAEDAQDLAALEVRSAADGDRAAVTEEVWRSASAWSSRSLLRALAQHRRRSSTPTEHEMRGELESAREDWARVLAEKTDRVRGNANPDDLADLLRSSARARERYEAARSKLVDALTTSLADALHQPTVSEMQAALGERNAALVEFATGRDRLYAYAVTQAGIRQFDLGPRGELERAALEFADDLRLATDAKRPRTGPQSLALGAELESRIVDPILRSIPATASTLVVVPCGNFGGLSFDALPLGTGSPGAAWPNEFLIERYAVAYAPSSAALVELAGRPPRTGPESALILADPRYLDGPQGGTRAMPTDVRDPRTAFPRLEQTREEACAIVKVLAGARRNGSVDTESRLEAIRGGRSRWSSESWSANGIELRLGAEATREAFLEGAPRASLLHVAAHGFADPTDAGGSGIALTWEEGSRGLVTYQDVLGLQLDADLAVLSACDTGAGPVFPRHGTLSLARAFLHAGSRAVVASLWAADDRVARELMESFYTEHVGRSRSAFIALREAKLALLRSSRPRSPADRARGNGPGTVASPGSGLMSGAHDWAAFLYFGLPR